MFTFDKTLFCFLAGVVGFFVYVLHIYAISFVVTWVTWIVCPLISSSCLTTPVPGLYITWLLGTRRPFPHGWKLLSYLVPLFPHGWKLLNCLVPLFPHGWKLLSCLVPAWLLGTINRRFARSIPGLETTKCLSTYSLWLLLGLSCFLPHRLTINIYQTFPGKDIFVDFSKLLPKNCFTMIGRLLTIFTSQCMLKRLSQPLMPSQ